MFKHKKTNENTRDKIDRKLYDSSSLELVVVVVFFVSIPVSTCIAICNLMASFALFKIKKNEFYAD